MASAGLREPLLGDEQKAAGPRRRGQHQADFVQSLLSGGRLQAPPACLECVERCKPFMAFLSALFQILAPLVAASLKLLYQLYRVTPANELRLLYGLALCFFGGEFCASIAAVECFRRTGGEKLVACVGDIAENARLVQEASEHDDMEARKQGRVVSSQEWCKGKALLALRVVDPDVLAQAFAGLYQGFLGMMMSLKFQFAWTVALACSIADILRKPAAFLVAPCLAAMLPKEYHKWIDQIINFTLKATAMHLAWQLQMAVSAVQSGLLGASLVGTSVVVLACKGCSWSGCGRCCKKRKLELETSVLDTAIGLPLAVVGIWFQVSHNYSLPFPYNLALLPLTMVESLLRFCITWFPVQEAVFSSR